MTKDDLKKLDAEIETLRFQTMNTPEAWAWKSRRVDRLELLQAEEDLARRQSKAA